MDEPQNNRKTGKPKGKPRGKPMQGNADPRRQGASKLPLGDTSLFEDMTYVRSHSKEEDRTEGHRDARRWKEKDLKGFLSRLSALEEAKARESGQANKQFEHEGSVPEMLQEQLAEEWANVERALSAQTVEPEPALPDVAVDPGQPIGGGAGVSDRSLPA